MSLGDSRWELPFGSPPVDVGLRAALLGRIAETTSCGPDEALVRATLLERSIGNVVVAYESRFLNGFVGFLGEQTYGVLVYLPETTPS